MGLETRVNRRKFLTVATGAGLAAAGFAGIAEAARPSAELKRDYGEWSQAQILELANSMALGKGQVKEAGEILIANQNGEPAFDGKSDYFIDKRDDAGIPLPIHIENSPLGDGASGGLIEYVGDKTRIKVRNGNSLQTVDEPSRVAITRIYLNPVFTEKMTTEGIGLLVATEINKYKSTDALMHLGEAKSATLPTNDDERRATMIYYLQKDILVFSMVDNNSHLTVRFSYQAIMGSWQIFQLAPDYLNARDANGLSSDDLNELKLFGQASDWFLKNNLLNKDGNGNYNWTKDGTALGENWMVLTKNLDVQISPQQPMGPLIPSTKPPIIKSS